MESTRKKTAAYLSQIYGETTNRKFKLMCSKITIGRSFHAEIRLKNPNISRNHCTLINTENGWTITDNNSQNGTYISGRKLKPHDSRLLQCGDIIFLGPPAEMPEAFCYDDAFVDDEDLLKFGHEVIELPPVKCKAETETLPSKKSLIKKCENVESNKILSSSINNEHIRECVDLPESKEISNSSKYKSKISNKKEMLLHKNKIPERSKSFKSAKLPSKLSGTNAESHTSSHFLCDNLSFIDSPPSKQLKLDDCDSGYQIHEISSTGDDKAEDSLSLLDTDKNLEASCSNSHEIRNIPENVLNSQTSKETDILKSKLAHLTDQIKMLEKSKLDLLKNYEVVCEKNFALDQQLTEKKKLEEDLKNCELKVKDKLKNELLEKFEEDLICNICTELLIKPTVLDCSHTFCIYCIKEWKKKKNECPICRHKIQTMTPILTLEHFIDKTLSTLTPEQKDKRNQLIIEREKQPKKNVTATSKRYRHGRRRNRRHATSVNRRLIHPVSRESDVEIVSERSSIIVGERSILPIPVAPVNIPSVYLRFRDVVFDNDSNPYVYIA